MKQRKWILGVSSAICELWLFAVLAVAGYYVGGTGVRYGEPIEWTRVVAAVPFVRWYELSMALSPFDVAFWISMLIWTMSAGRPSRKHLWIATLSPLILLFPINMLGMIAAIGDGLGPSDGEMLAEHWPIFHVYGIWTIVAMVVPFVLARQAHSVAKLR